MKYIHWTKIKGGTENIVYTKYSLNWMIKQLVSFRENLRENVVDSKLPQGLNWNKSIFTTISINRENVTKY